MCLTLYELLLRMLVIDLHAKNQKNICKGIEKSLEDCSNSYLLSVRHIIVRKKKMRCNKTQT